MIPTPLDVTAQRNDRSDRGGDQDGLTIRLSNSTKQIAFFERAEATALRRDGFVSVAAAVGVN